VLELPLQAACGGPDGEAAVAEAPHSVQERLLQQGGLLAGLGHRLAAGWAQLWPVVCSRLVAAALLARRLAMAVEHHRKAPGMARTAVVLAAGLAPRRRLAPQAVPCDARNGKVPCPAEVALVAPRALVAVLGTSLASWGHKVGGHIWAAVALDILVAALVVAHLEVHVEGSPTVVGVQGNTLEVEHRRAPAGPQAVEAQRVEEQARLEAVACLHPAETHLAVHAESA